MLIRVNSNKGLIKTIILVVVALLILSYFGFNLKNLADSPTTKTNFSFVVDILSTIWNEYLKAPVIFISKIFYQYILVPFFHNLENLGREAPLVPPAN